MKKDTRFKRKYSSNDKVEYKGKTWTVCKDAVKDSFDHLHYKICRGSWKKYVRSDYLTPA